MGSLYRSQQELIFVFKHGRGAHRNNVQRGEYGRNRGNLKCCRPLAYETEGKTSLTLAHTLSDDGCSSVRKPLRGALHRLALAVCG